MQEMKANGDYLKNLAEIINYSGYSEKVLKSLHREKGFPMAFLGGRWESYRSLIDEWRRKMILSKD